MQEHLASDKEAGQSQEKGPDRAGKAAAGQRRGRPKGTSHPAQKPDGPRESGAAAAARLFSGTHKRKPEGQTEEASAVRRAPQFCDPMGRTVHVTVLGEPMLHVRSGSEAPAQAGSVRGVCLPSVPRDSAIIADTTALHVGPGASTMVTWSNLDFTTIHVARQSHGKWLNPSFNKFAFYEVVSERGDWLGILC